jgi:hypothetical protein
MTEEQTEIEALFLNVISAPRTPFPSKGVSISAPDQKGVYVIHDQGGRVLHVGMTPKAKGGIAQRLRDHMAGNSSFTDTYLKGNGKALRDGCTFQCLVVPEPRKRALLEALSTGRLCPAHIGHSAQ